MEYTLPEQLRDVTVDGTMLDENNQKIGTLSISDDKTKLELIFSEGWLEQVRKAGSTTIETGSFYIEARVDLKQISTEGELKLVIGNVEITMNFGDDILAQYGDVQIEKTLGKVQDGAQKPDGTVQKEDDGDYLYYTLKVTAGEYGCPNVSVKDQFYDEDKQYIVGYTFLPEEKICSGETKKIESSSTSFTWTIGDMEAGEVRILTYKVKLTDTYLAGKTPQDPSLQNKATVYTKNTESGPEYERDSATAKFTAKGEATLTKVASDYMPDQAGGGKIRYTIWIKADDANTYTLNNVKIKDALDGTKLGSWPNATDSSIRKQIYYEEDSFALFEGGGSTDLTKVDPQPSGQPVLMDTDQDGLRNDSFTYAVGPLAPGECRTLVYEVHIKPEVFAAAGNNSVTIRNRAAVITEDEKEVYNTFSVTKDIGRKTWLRKMADTAPTENAQTITASGSIYQYNESAQIVQSDSAQPSFTVPEGSFQYQVVINEAGGWNLTNAQMTDTITRQNRIAYTGYVRIDAYTISSSADGQLTVKTDADALKILKTNALSKTVWLDVDGRYSFSFTPKDLGLDGVYAYLLTYYAVPTDLIGVTTAQILNTFELTGSAVWGIGDGNTSYEFPKISANASIQVEGSNYFSAEKKAWYYEEKAENSSTGAIYWVIKVSGKTIPAGTTFSDNWKKAGALQSFHSVVGVYRSTIEDITETFKDAKALNNAAEAAQLTKLKENEDYTVEPNEQSYNFTLSKELVLKDKEYLYFVMSTQPDQLPKGNRGSNTYTNAFFAKDKNSNEWYELDRDSYTVYSKTGIFKELGQIFQYDGTTAKEIQKGDNGSSSLPLDQWKSNPDKFIPGYYVAWQIQVNHDASLDGRYRIVEQIPNGMEAVCVRTYWEGSEISNKGTAPTFQEIEGLDSSWTKHNETYSGKASIYYTNGQQLIWEAGDFHRETDRTKSHKDLWSVEYQIICRVTDPEVLLGGAAKDFCNQVSLYQKDNLISKDSHSVTIQRSNLTKDGKQYENPKSEYEFTIKVNPLGTDLLKGSDRLTIVDQMSDNLIFLPETLVVKNSNRGEALAADSWNSSYDPSEHILTLTVPDNLPLTITYRAKIDARPGEKVAISNQAYWKGYEKSVGATFTEADVSYEAGGTAVAATTPTVQVLKYDQNDTNKTLQGAEFSLTPGTVSLEGETAGQFAATVGSEVIKGTTDENGQITFSTCHEYILAFNQIYCLTETKAPAGYVLDSTPHYFVVTKEPTANTSDTEKTKYEDLQECLNSLKELQSENKITVTEQQAKTGTIYTHYAYNHKGEISVEKHFLNVTGEDLGSKLSGTYRFGLYKKPAPTEADKPVQTIELVFQADSTAQTAKFSNLDLNTSYYVYELDDQGKPIMAGAEATVSGIPFIVTYTKKQGNTEMPSITLTADEWSGQAYVYNQINYPELPQTGGTGTIHYPQIGLLLLLLSGLLGLYFKSRSAQRTK